MKRHKQLNRHDPENGVWGDCWRTAIACILDLEPGEVPHVFDNDAPVVEADAAMQAWMEHRGLYVITVTYDCPDVDLVMGAIHHHNPELRYILMGTSRNGTNHAVVCHGDRIEWDPSQNDSGIVAPAEGPNGERFFWVFFIGKRV